METSVIEILERELPRLVNLSQKGLSYQNTIMSIAAEIEIVKLSKSKRYISLHDIANAVNAATNFDIQERTKLRSRERVMARQLFFFLCRKYTRHTLKSLGKYIGGKDHTTVVHGVRVYKNLLTTNDQLAHKTLQDAEEFLKQLN